MREREEWRELPLNDEVRQFIEASQHAHLEERRAMIRFAPVLCTCTRWYDWRHPEPPQVDCMVHTTIAFNDGEWM